MKAAERASYNNNNDNDSDNDNDNKNNDKYNNNNNDDNETPPHSSLFECCGVPSCACLSRDCLGKMMMAFFPF
eukprot:COSAG06_NODE_5393_length_3508_cov_29.096509_1_plen_73_part_00